MGYNVLKFAITYYSPRLGYTVAMDLRQPMRVVTPTLDGDVLAILARADKAFSNSEIAGAILGVSKEGVRKALGRLVEQGIVESTRAGNALMYRLNRDHLAAPAIEALANIRLRLVARLRETIGEWSVAPVAAALFGSAGRGDGAASSDLDILVIRSKSVDVEDETWREQLAALEHAATRWTGNDARVLEYGEEDLSRRQEPVVVSALQEGIELAGSLRSLRLRTGRSAR